MPAGAHKEDTVLFYVVVGTVCKSSAHNATIKTGDILSLIHEFKPAAFHATCFGDNLFHMRKTCTLGNCPATCCLMYPNLQTLNSRYLNHVTSSHVSV